MVCSYDTFSGPFLFNPRKHLGAQWAVLRHGNFVKLQLCYVWAKFFSARSSHPPNNEFYHKPWQMMVPGPQKETLAHANQQCQNSFLFWWQSYPVQALRQQDNRLRSPETVWPAWPEACSFVKVPKRSCLSKLLGISVNPETKNEGAKLWKKFSATVRPVGNSTSWYLAVHIPVESGLPWCWVQFITNDKLPVKMQLRCRNIQLFVYRDQRMKGLIIQQTQARRRKSLKPREVIIAFCAGWF